MTTTYIDISGEVPGNTFTGTIVLDETISNGIGYFQLVEGSLIDLSGKVGITTVEGDSIYIDKIPPIIPSSVNIKLSNGSQNN